MPRNPFDLKFIVVVGKGGVGKSTMSASLALAHAAAGRRVLLAMVQNLADDEVTAQDQGQRMPSTRALGQRRNATKEPARKPAQKTVRQATRKKA